MSLLSHCGNVCRNQFFGMCPARSVEVLNKSLLPIHSNFCNANIPPHTGSGKQSFSLP